MSKSGQGTITLSLHPVLLRSFVRSFCVLGLCSHMAQVGPSAVDRNHAPSSALQHVHPKRCTPHHPERTRAGIRSFVFTLQTLLRMREPVQLSTQAAPDRPPPSSFLRQLTSPGPLFHCFAIQKVWKCVGRLVADISGSAHAGYEVVGIQRAIEKYDVSAIMLGRHVFFNICLLT